MALDANNERKKEIMMDKSILDKLTERLFKILPAIITRDKILVEKFQLLIEATDYARDRCLTCDLPEGENRTKAVKQAILNFGITFEELNSEIERITTGPGMPVCKNFLNEHAYFYDCLLQRDLFKAIANILVIKI